MRLAPGSRLGPYEVVAQIGAGGMGEVYRARDLKLNREVALKVLPEVFASDADRLARFKREAQVLASLSHPNIGGIYGFEESDGQHALVLELIDGQTLAHRIRQGRIAVDEALAIARQMADALDTAHQRGVIHRDLKPANVKLTPKGTVKVLDFGLAKFAAPLDSELQTSDQAQSSTVMSSLATQLGVIMGTTAYMSPEQARGLPVDRGTDIWAFGCVLYEMLTGRSPFAGETNSDTIARLIEREPDWRQLPASTPAKVHDVLRRCLQKDPQRRLRDIADARIEIEESSTALNRPRRVVGLPVVVAGVAIALLASVWWYAKSTVPHGTHEPVSVLIADFQNRTGDPTFDRTLEPILRLALEGAGFISAYDRAGIVRSLGTRPPETFDERAALELAVKQGIGVVLSGSVGREGPRYSVSVKATQAVTDVTLISAADTATSKDHVLGVATTLASEVREALGDTTSDSAKRFAMETLSTTSLEAVREYARGMEAMSSSRFDEAFQNFSRAVALDPKFGVAYGAMAATSRNLERQQDAEKYAQEAIRLLDNMTERERFRTRGFYYSITNDYQACVKEYGDLIARYSADAAARNNRALCLTQLRNMPEAVEEMRKVVQILPNRTLYRTNLALYADYNGDFQAAEQEVRAMQNPDLFARIALAFAQVGQAQVAQAADTYEKLEKADQEGASYTTSGLGDLAIYEGRFSDAARILAQGAATDLSSEHFDKAASKFAALAYAELLRQQRGAAIAKAEKALANSQSVKTRFLAARIFVEAGAAVRARTLAAGLAAELQAEPQAYGAIIQGLAALNLGDSRQAIKVLTEANGLLDTWIGHFDLGRAYLDAGAFTQADSEFDRCIKRRGEALALFLDEEPTYGYFPPVYYYQGRVREALKTSGFAESYRSYLRIRGRSSEDALVKQLRRAGF